MLWATTHTTYRLSQQRFLSFGLQSKRLRSLYTAASTKPCWNTNKANAWLCYRWSLLRIHTDDSNHPWYLQSIQHLQPFYCQVTAQSPFRQSQHRRRHASSLWGSHWPCAWLGSNATSCHIQSKCHYVAPSFPCLEQASPEWIWRCFCFARCFHSPGQTCEANI